MDTALEYALRLCGPGDEETLALVGAASFLEAFAGVLVGEDVLAHCRNQHSAAKYAGILADPAARTCVAEVRQAPVGYAVLCPPDLPVPTTVEDVELKRIYLLHRFQGSGIGSALMEWSMEAARNAGKRRLLLGVYDGNATAVAFYLRHGFEHAGTRTFQVGSHTYSDFVLARVL